MGKKDIFYFSGTHWDREWYQTFQGFRYRLVQMLDGVLHVMENNEGFGVFHLDGQTIVLEDYAEIKPENAEKLKKYIAQGRIKIGPWYAMPDEFNLSGESLIRNLMMGHELAKKWGAESAWKLGYMCDIFGHIAQMPQILNGFDIKYSHQSRGVEAFTEPYFIWRSPDGSETINMRIGDFYGYGEYCTKVIMFEDKNDPNVLVQRTHDYIDHIFNATKYPVYVVPDANDHQPIHDETDKYINIIKEYVPDANVHHTDLIEACKLLEQYRGEMDVVTGELNKTNKKGFPDLITNTVSSYYTLKKANDECQIALEKVAEPMSAAAMINGYPFVRNYLKLAYKYLIQNHPHDSICGCSIDQVHKDMEYRFDQTKEICHEIKMDFIRKNTNEFEYIASIKDTDAILTLFNPLPYEREEVVTIEIPMKKNFPTVQTEGFRFEYVNSFFIRDFDGNDIPYQITDVKKDQVWRVFEHRVEIVDNYTISFKAKLPAGGKCEYQIVPNEGITRYMKHLKSTVDSMENEHICVKINPNGTICVTDKHTGKTYDNQLTLIDDIEIGDGWYHATTKNNNSVISSFGNCYVEKIESGVSRCVFKIIKQLRLPKSYQDNRCGFSRSRDYELCDAVFEVGLSENARFVDVKLKFDNKVCDHRLRIAMPTYTQGDKYFAGQAFYCCQRNVDIDYNTHDWIEHEQYEKAMNGIMGKRDRNGEGLAFVSATGIHECASFADENATLYATLMRGFKKTVNTSGEIRGQLLGELEYNFRLVPLDNTITYAGLVRMQECMGVGNIFDYTEAEKGTTISAPVSDYQLFGKHVLMSTIKVAESGENAVVARVFCASDKDSSATLKLSKEIKSAQLVNLNEEPTDKGDIKVRGNTVEFKVPAWKIITVKLSF